MNTDQLSPSEALYGFAAWLTTQENPITASSSHDAAIWADKVNEFCEANNLAEPREGWNLNLKHPVST